MPTIIVPHPVASTATIESVVRDLFWYDDIKKEMKKFSGGKLDFEYKFDKSIDPPRYRLLPRVTDLEVEVSNRTYDKRRIRSWHRRYENYNHTKSKIIDISEKGVVFSVPDEEVDEFTYNLERKGFRFRVR